jgi:hypothetical protein
MSFIEFVAGSKSGKVRAEAATDVGERPGICGTRPYLNAAEVDTLIQTLIDWPDVRTQPRVSDVPLIVFFSFFSYFLSVFTLFFCF